MLKPKLKKYAKKISRKRIYEYLLEFCKDVHDGDSVLVIGSGGEI